MIADIFKSYALTYNGSHVFYQGIQKALYLGHERSNPIRQIFSGKTIRLGEFYALLVQTYSVAYHNIALHLTTDFLEFLYLGIGDNRTIYGSLTAINQIIEYLPGLSMDPLDEQ